MYAQMLVRVAFNDYVPVTALHELSFFIGAVSLSVITKSQIKLLLVPLKESKWNAVQLMIAYLLLCGCSLLDSCCW